jgi:hypothetical protein
VSYPIKHIYFQKEKAAPKPKKAKEVKKTEPEKEVPAENGEAKAEEDVRDCWDM